MNNVIQMSDLLKKPYSHGAIGRGEHLHYDGDDLLLIFFSS